MKKHITLFIILFVVISSFAQQGINYKALIKDDLGNVLANDLIIVQFQILQGEGMTNVYQETHTPTTDANGIVIVNIGEGSVNSGIYNDIDWAVEEHFLNVQINTGGGLIDMGTTQFMAVPYAKHATTADNVFSGDYNDLTNQPTTLPTGLEKITENNGNIDRSGWRLIGVDPENYGPIGQDALDLSSNIVTIEGRVFGAIGDNSIAFGTQTNSSGFGSIATGVATEALGDVTTTMGYGTITSELASMAVGNSNIDISTGLFIVGNGEFNGGSPIRSNALEVYKNGTITAPSFDLSEITDDKALITKEYADVNLGSSGLEQITEGGNTGWRLIGSDASNYADIGENAIDLSYNDDSGFQAGATGDVSTAMGLYIIASGNYSTAMGHSTNASGDYSTAMGFATNASGDFSIAMGRGTLPSGDYSTAIGEATIASGNHSIAMGYSTTASGDYSTVMGIHTNAESYASLAIGRYNIGGGSDIAWSDSNPLFEIGNGFNDANRNNALTVLKNGKTGIGIATPSSLLEVAHKNGSPEAESFSVLNTDTNNSWQFHTTSYLNLYRNGVFKGSWNATSGAYVQASDRRVKKDIIPLDNGTLNKVMQLNPVSYLMKDQTDSKRNLGLISQEVKELFPSITHYVKDSDLLALSYTELIPILIKALQEQQEIIDGQQITIESQKAKDKIQDKSIEALVARLNLIESNSSN
ncbi:tail fiber domain-containing protein [Psychroserpens sp.]|uniref:tail fiber domain-containing protein n=1 Tax=Psychroserpens sp. TaxID=2020870 RepID=UPI00385E9AA8